MPELPEVETVRRGLQPAMEGARFTKVEMRRPDLRFPLPKNFVKRLEGQTVTGLGRRAKYLLADLSSGDVLMMHLGMSGSFRVAEEKGGKKADKKGDKTPGDFHHPRGRSHPRPHRVPHVLGRPHRLQRSAPLWLDEARPARRARRPSADEEIGPEPLGNQFDAAMLAAACHGKQTNLKAALLDQTVVAGLGNMYVCEALYRARLSPKRKASTIADRKGAPNERAERLVDAIKAVLGDAIKAGGSSLRDHRRTDGELGYFQHHFRVYDREGKHACMSPGCKGTVKRIVQAGRSTFFCPACQT